MGFTSVSQDIGDTGWSERNEPSAIRGSNRDQEHNSPLNSNSADKRAKHLLFKMAYSGIWHDEEERMVLAAVQEIQEIFENRNLSIIPHLRRRLEIFQRSGVDLNAVLQRPLDENGWENLAHRATAATLEDAQGEIPPNSRVGVITCTGPK